MGIPESHVIVQWTHYPDPRPQKMLICSQNDAINFLQSLFKSLALEFIRTLEPLWRRGLKNVSGSHLQSFCFDGLGLWPVIRSLKSSSGDAYVQ